MKVVSDQSARNLMVDTADSYRYQACAEDIELPAK